MDGLYIRDAGEAVAHHMHAGKPCELAYTPGNMTLYELVFTPCGWSLDSAADRMNHEKRRSITKDRPELSGDEVPDAWIVLSWLGHGAWPVDLRAIPHGNYLAEKFDAAGAQADGEALRLLLVAVSQAMRFPMAVVQ